MTEAIARTFAANSKRSELLYAPESDRLLPNS